MLNKIVEVKPSSKYKKYWITHNFLCLLSFLYTAYLWVDTIYLEKCETNINIDIDNLTTDNNKKPIIKINNFKT